MADDEPLGPVVQQEADGVARFDAPLGQHERQPVGPLLELAERQPALTV